MQKERVQLQLEVRPNGVFLAGGQMETQPSFVIHTSYESPLYEPRRVFPDAPIRGTWHTYAQSAATAEWLRPKTPLVFNLPAPGDVDAKIGIRMVAKTSYTGTPVVEPILRDISAGSAFVSVAQLLQWKLSTDANKPPTFDVTLVDDIYYREMMRTGLLGAAKGDATVFNNPVAMLGEARVAEINSDAFCLATKAHLSLDLRDVSAADAPVRLRTGAFGGTSATAAAMTAYLASVAGKPAIHEPALMEKWAAVMNRLEYHYWCSATDLPPPPDANPEDVARQRLPADPRSPLMKNLFMSRYTTPVGDLPPHAFLRQDRTQRLATAPSAVPSPKFPDAALTQIRNMLLSSLLAHGMRPSYFETVVRTQLATTEDRIQSSFLTALRVVADMATFSAYMGDYESDQRFGNVAYLQTLSAEKQAMYTSPPATTAPATGRTAVGAAATTTPSHPLFDRTRAALMMRQHVEHAAFSHIVRTAYASEKLTRGVRPDAFFRGNDAPEAAPGGPAAAALSPADALALKTRRDCEDWRPPSTSLENAMDCEDFAHQCTHAIDQMTRALQAARPHTTDTLLGALADLLMTRRPTFVGGTVSNPFVDARASAGGSKPTAAPPVHRELPIVGSPEEAKMFAGEGGHGYALLEGRVPVARRFERGIANGYVTAEDAPAMRAHYRSIMEKAQPWEARDPSLVLEGTGSVHPLVLPAEQVYAGTDRADVYVRKTAAGIQFARDIYNEATPEHAALKAVVRLQTQPYEARDTPDKDRLVSPFYKSIGHNVFTPATSPFAINQHVLTCDAATKTRGVLIADYLRDSLDASGRGTVMYCSPYTQYMTNAQWTADVEPLMMRILGQDAVSSFLRSGVPAPEQVAQPLAASALQGLAGLGSTAANDVLARLDQVCRPPAQDLAGAPLAADAVAGMARAFATLERTDEMDALSNFQMYIPAWKFASMSPEAVRSFTAALDALQARGTIVEYAMTRERGLPHFNDCVRLIVALPVPDTLDPSKFPVRGAQ